MNFVSHFFLDRDHPSALYALGAATPDLLSIYNSGLRIKSGHVRKMTREAREQIPADFLMGLERHYEADAVFHSMPLFTEETGHLTQLMLSELPAGSVPRTYFVSHILLELMMDKVLIDNHPGLLKTYYNHYQQLAPYKEVQAITERVAGHPMPAYHEFLEKFAGNQYLYHYQEFDHIIYIIRRLLRRVGVEEHAFLEHPAFLALMRTYESRLSSLIGDIFAALPPRMS